MQNMRRNRLLRLFAEGRVDQSSRTVQAETEVNVLPRIPAALRRDGAWLNALDNLDLLALHQARLGLFTRRLGREEKRYDPKDPTLQFVEKEDELDFLCEGFTSRRALMSCGHAVTPTSLTNWCLKLLDDGKSRFVCGQTGCNVEWSYEEVCKMALLTPEEKKLFEKAMSSNAARGNTKLCPRCESPVVRTNLSHLRVRCKVCKVKGRRTYHFCWQCLRQWKGPAPRSDHCDNDGCCNESVKTLHSCPDILLESVKCPSIRACPTCGILLQHDNTMCKNVDCPRCKMHFCFVCLSVTCFSKCTGVSPRQTSVPVWQKK